MKEMAKTIKFSFDLIGGFIGALMGALIGDLNGLLLALIIFMCADYVTGVLAAIMSRKLSSAVGFKGLLKKAAILIVVIIGHTLDAYVLKQGNACRSAVVMFYIFNEGISIVENYGKLGLPFPEKLKKIIASLNEK